MKICFNITNKHLIYTLSQQLIWFKYQHVNITGKTKYEVKTSTQTLLLIISEHLQYFSDGELDLNRKIY